MTSGKHRRPGSPRLALQFSQRRKRRRKSQLIWTGVDSISRRRWDSHIMRMYQWVDKVYRSVRRVQSSKHSTIQVSGICHWKRLTHLQCSELLNPSQKARWMRSWGWKLNNNKGEGRLHGIGQWSFNKMKRQVVLMMTQFFMRSETSGEVLKMRITWKVFTILIRTQERKVWGKGAAESIKVRMPATFVRTTKKYSVQSVWSLTKPATSRWWGRR